jgi:prepilin signal peptidase PulO-like enzyme (type II secretory pathway)
MYTTFILYSLFLISVYTNKGKDMMVKITFTIQIIKNLLKALLNYEANVLKKSYGIVNFFEKKKLDMYYTVKL